ncbi:aminotransferase class III-fold pyridoxal phosphate-dependent enzyme [Pseudomonas psychrophila]|uniref:aminotransferase class III-fold pyridoxal phosphate-dependent enzyme n=1 Tax=Pseudomonas psychrophila TaxID=122355 RepID=UPI000523F8EB|nr:aminotransferase class III-fold pyridoxal phosphate-dependent enzyme [Pseudomonas psychrophila]
MSSIQEKDQHWVHPVTALMDHQAKGVCAWKSADRIHLTDVNGHRVQDAFSGLWCVNAGYGQPTIVEAARKQLEVLPYATGYFGFGSEPAIELAYRLAKLAPAGLNHVIFGQGGSDAVDTAIRTVSYYFNAIGRPEKKHFIAVQRGYHGSSAMGSGLTALPVFHRYFDVPTPTQHHIEAPYTYRHSAGPDEAAVLRATVAALESKVQEIGEDKVAAFICEPIIGSGGVIVPPAGYLKAMRATCDKLGILLIVDEVITGFGRTGPMFTCEHEGVSPDLMTLAKGLTSGYAPMGATIISDKIFAAIAEAGAGGIPFGHGQTYAGHPVSAAIANATLDLYENGLLQNGTEVGEYFQTRLRSLESLSLVGQVRGQGMLAGLELITDKNARTKPDANLKLGQKILAHAFTEGLVFRAFADDILGFAPSLNYTKADVDNLIDILTFSIEKVSGASWI